MSDTLFNRIRNLEREVDQVRLDLAMTIEERDMWKDKAVELSHLITYLAEKQNHSGLTLTKGGG